jgi:dTDP-4-dehydrorhamnose 3,5-epimerase
MIFTATEIDGVVVIDIEPHGDDRGFLARTHCRAANRRSLHPPEGCAQGYQTLEDNTELYYEMSRESVPAAARGVRCDDPGFGIGWPSTPPSAISERDRAWPLLPM